MNDFDRQPGEAAHQVARLLQHEGLEMHKLPVYRSRRTAAKAEMLFSEERMRVENALRESRHEEHQAV